MVRTLKFSPASTAVGGLLLLLAACAAQAQVYRHVGPDGKVSYSDQPADAAAPLGKSGTAAGAAAPAGSALPYDLRQIANRYPVTLYTGDNCAPCTSARNLLLQRGVPFTERTVNTAEDADALQRLGGDTSLPLGRIGGQQLRGFSDSEWSQYLDAAGYPKTSQLPSAYRNAAATPLVAAKRTAPATPATPAASPVAPPPASIAPRTGAAGIQF